MKKGFLVALVITLMMSITNVSAMTKDELKTIIEKGRQNAIHYSADNIANKYINLYINLCTIS